MTDETPPEAAPAKKTSGKGAMIGVAVAMLAAGGGAGAFVVAPRLAPHAPAAGEPGETEGHGTGEGEGEANAPTIRLDNIIVNPAGSQGSRFLMATVALQVPDEPTRARLQNREVEVRDTLVATLASQTLESLTRPGAREALKRSLSDAVQPLAGRGARIRVFLPQFVIQ